MLTKLSFPLLLFICFKMCFIIWLSTEIDYGIENAPYDTVRPKVEIIRYLVQNSRMCLFS